MEYRTGNWVLNHQGSPFQVAYGEEINDSKPIPISPELLDNLGFEKRFTTGNVWDLEETGICLAHLEEEGQWKYLTAPSANIIKYLHQLQNLYFIITGEELEVQIEQAYSAVSSPGHQPVQSGFSVGKQSHTA